MVYLIANNTILATCQVDKTTGSLAARMKPDILLLDEPTSALDPELVGEVERSIANAAKSGQTMILVSQRYVLCLKWLIKVLFLDKRKDYWSLGTPDEIINHPKEERTKEFLLVTNGPTFDIIEDKKTQLAS